MNEARSAFSRNAGPAVIAALALAIVSAAAAGASPAAPGVRSLDARMSFEESETTRLLAAAVEAAKNLLGVEPGSGAMLHFEPADLLSAVVEAGALPLRNVDLPVSALALDAHLIDLPPPVC